MYRHVTFELFSSAGLLGSCSFNHSVTVRTVTVLACISSAFDDPEHDQVCTLMLQQALQQQHHHQLQLLTADALCCHRHHATNTSTTSFPVGQPMLKQPSLQCAVKQLRHQCSNNPACDAFRRLQKSHGTPHRPPLPARQYFMRDAGASCMHLSVRQVRLL